MTVFISGGAKCGKSSFAQNLTVALAGNGKRYYVATMIPTGEEDYARIRGTLLTGMAWVLKRWSASVISWTA